MQGWTGKTVIIDLKDGKITKLERFEYLHSYIGGRGLGVKLYYGLNNS